MFNGAESTHRHNQLNKYCYTSANHVLQHLIIRMLSCYNLEMREQVQIEKGIGQQWNVVEDITDGF